MTGDFPDQPAGNTPQEIHAANATGAYETAETSVEVALVEQIAERTAAIRRRIADAADRAGRDPVAVTLIAVSKTHPASVVRAASAAGLSIFGENRVQEAREKIATLAGLPLTWELIGHLQSNKANRAAELFARVQSVDTLHLAQALDARAAALGRTLPILLEVNVSGEASKSGFALDEVVDVARALTGLPHLRLEGLMTVAPQVADPEQARPVFRRLRELADELRQRVPLGPDGGWRTLSMGMTDDFEAAIAEGATVVRIGRALFGERPRP